MDRFKFRIWDNKTQSYKYKFDLTDGCYELDYIFNGMKFSEECSMYPLVGIDKNDFGIIEQCTGLKDKNGNLIYEGDIVRRYVGLGKHGSQKTEDIDVVKWHINGYVLENYCDYFADTDDFEVIGNIHEGEK